MKHRDIDLVTVKSVIEQAFARGATFRTKEVSTHPRMTAAHAAVVNEMAYHKVVGTLLSLKRVYFGIDLLEDRPDDAGHNWRRR